MKSDPPSPSQRSPRLFNLNEKQMNSNKYNINIDISQLNGMFLLEDYRPYESTFIDKIDSNLFADEFNNKSYGIQRLFSTDNYEEAVIPHSPRIREDIIGDIRIESPERYSGMESPPYSLKHLLRGGEKPFTLGAHENIGEESKYEVLGATGTDIHDLQRQGDHPQQAPKFVSPLLLPQPETGTCNQSFDILSFYLNELSPTQIVAQLTALTSYLDPSLAEKLSFQVCKLLNISPVSAMYIPTTTPPVCISDIQARDLLNRNFINFSATVSKINTNKKGSTFSDILEDVLRNGLSFIIDLLQLTQNENKTDSSLRLEEVNMSLIDVESIPEKRIQENNLGLLNPNIINANYNSTINNKRLQPMDESTHNKRIKRSEESKMDSSMDWSMTSTPFNSKTKKSPKIWSEWEENELIRILTGRVIAEINDREWENIGEMLGRGVCSIHAKARSLMKRRECVSLPINNKSENSSIFEFNSHPTLELNLPITNKKAKQKNKLIGKSYYDLIWNALHTLPLFQGTKDQILCTIMKNNNLAPQQLKSVQSSILQCLSRKFIRLKSTYRLNNNLCNNSTNMSKEQSKSVRLRLIYILGKGNPMNLEEIKTEYKNEFMNKLDFSLGPESNIPVWEKTLQKTLHSNPELFLRDTEKTKYTYEI